MTRENTAFGGMCFDEANFAQLLNALSAHPWVTRNGVRFLASIDARFDMFSADTLIWCWGNHRTADRALEGGLAYHDHDGQIVGIVLKAEGNQVTEIELWRGDDLPILSLPKPLQLWEVTPGAAYSSRA